MRNRTAFIDELITAGAQDDEIEEALKLAESRGEFSASSTTAPSAPKEQGYFSGFGQRFNEAAAATQADARQGLADIKKWSEDTPGQGFQNPNPLKRLETAAIRLPARVTRTLDYTAGAALSGLGNAILGPAAKAAAQRGVNPESNADTTPGMSNFGQIPSARDYQQANEQIGKAVTPVAKSANEFYQSRDPMYKEALRTTAVLPQYIVAPPAAKAAEAGAISGAKTATGALKSGISNTLKSIDKKAGEVISELSDVPEEALRKYGSGKGQGAAELKAAIGTERDIGLNILNKLDNIEDYIPERNTVNRALAEMPDVNIGNTVETLLREKERIVGGTPAAQSGKEKIDALVKTMLSVADEKGNIPAPKFRALRMEIDSEIGAAFNRDYKDYIEKAGVSARNQMAADLVKTAESIGKPEYAEAMQNYARKIQLVDKLKGYIGQSSEVRDRRIEGFINNLFGKNKTKARETLEGLSDVFGENFLEQARNAQLAQSLGPEGKPALFSRKPTGRSGLGVLSGAAVGAGAGTITGDSKEGAAIGAGLGYLASSPALGSKILALTGALARKAGKAAGEIPPAINKAAGRPILPTGNAPLSTLSKQQIEALAKIPKPSPRNEPYSPDFTPPDIAALPKATRYNSPEAIAKAEAELQYAARGDQPDEFFTNPVNTAMTADEERIAHELTQGGRDIETMTGTANALKRDFFKNQGAEVSLDKMDPGRRKVLNERIEAINTMHDTDYPAWAREYGSQGYPDTGKLHEDDIELWINRSAGKKRSK